MKNRRVLMIIGGLLGLSALCCVGIVVLAVLDEQSDDDSTQETRSLWALKAACNGEAVPETAAFDPDASGIHPAAILQETAEEDYIFVNNDWSFRPDTLQKAELVICLENVVETVTETCEYTLEEGGGDATITRISLVADYRLVAAQSGKLVDEGTIKANPRQCLDEETFYDNASFTLRGSFGEALEPLLNEYINGS